MDLFDVLMRRRSVRSFEDRPVPPVLLRELLEVANNSPSGGNIQPLSIVVVTEEEGRTELAEIVGGQPWVRNAPVSLIFCLDFYRVKEWAAGFGVEFLGEKIFGSFLIAYADVMCAAQSVVALAESRGLGSVYVGTILSNMSRARKFFSMPRFVLPMMVLSLGYPKSVPSGIPKLSTDVVVHHERYSTPTQEEATRAFEEKYGSIEDDIDSYLKRAYVEVVEADKQQDDAWTEHARSRMEKLAIKSNAEFLFRLRYPQRTMLAMNAGFLDSLREAGFSFDVEEAGVSD